MNKQKWQNLFAVLIFFAVLTILPFLSMHLTKVFESYSAKKAFPRIDITLNDVTLEEIQADKEIIYYDNGLVVNDGTKTDAFSHVQIKGHGNSSWVQPKKSYQIKFDDDYSLLGLPPTKKWILIANYLDDSLLRNDLAFYVDRMLESSYSRQGEFTDLYIDGEYYGVYYVTHKIRVDRTEVALKDPNGILVEMDHLHFGGAQNCFKIVDRACLVAADTVSKDENDTSIADFTSAFMQLRAAIKEKDYARITDLLDVESAAKYYLLSEFTINPDAYTTSLYMYKDGAADKIHFGPAWDFDYALGNKRWDYGAPPDFFLPDGDHNVEKLADDGGWSVTRLIYDLTKIPDFMDVTKQIFREKMSGRCEELISYLKSRRDFISEHAHLDDEKWEKDTFDAETDYLIDWVTKRFDHFEQVYGTQNIQPWDKAFVL